MAINIPVHIFGSDTGPEALSLLDDSFAAVQAALNSLSSVARTAGEISAGVTPANFLYPPGDARRYGYAPDSGSTDNTAAIQNAFNANASYFPVIIPGNGYGKMTGRVTAPANLHIIMREGAELRWSATTANGTNFLGAVTRPGIEITGDTFLLEGRGKITGPSVGIYVGNECGLLRIGTSAANRGTGFIVRDVEITNWGAYGVALQFVQDIECTGMSVHNNGFHGYAFLSCQNGRAKRNKIYNMTPGTSGNMYGLSCTHDSAGYNTDPNVTAAPRQTVNPFCIDFDVSENEVYGINWIGLDAHGGYELNYHDNKVYDCYIGIQISGSSAAAANYAGENNKVNANTVYATQINGNATTTSGHSGQQYGITLNGGATLLHRGVECIGNTIVGCGDVSGAGGNAYSIQCTFMQDAVILGNSIRGWYSVGIYGSNFDGTMSNNVFTGPANVTLSKVLWLDSNSAKTTINGNRLEIHGGIAPLEGIRVSSTGSSRPVVGANEVTQATTPYSGDIALFSSGMSDVTPRIQDTTTGSHTINVGPLGASQLAYVEYIGGGSATLTDLLNPRQGTIYTIGVSVTQTLTISGAAYKLSGATAAITQFGTLTLLCVATSNPKFQEIGRSPTNT